MKAALVVIVAIACAACGGKSRSAQDPGATPSCCCSWGEGQEVVAEASCRERGGNCDPVDACDQTGGEGGSGHEEDPGDY